MAITLDQANIYTGAGTNQINHTITTTAAVASGAMITILAHRFKSGTSSTLSGSGGGLTWANAHDVSSGNIRMYLICAFAASGLASGSTLTVNGSLSGNDYTVGVASYLGVDQSGGTIASAIRAVNGVAASTAAWGSGSVAGNSGDGLIGGAGGDGTLRTSTTDAPGVERIDFNSATSSGSITLADKLSITGATSLDGDFSGTLGHVALAVAFIPAAGAAATSLVIPRRAHRGLYMR